MATTITITNFCKIAEDYGREIGLADFEIERIVHSKTQDTDEWIFHLKIRAMDPSIEDDNHGAIIVVDALTEKPRLIEGL